MQMQRVETKAGTAISAPRRGWHGSRVCQAVLAVEVLHFHGRVVDEDADRERHSPERHELSVWPEPIETMIETRSASGMDVITTTVERQLPRKSSNMIPVSRRDGRLRDDPTMAPFTKTD